MILKVDLQYVHIGRVNPKQKRPQHPYADSGMLEGWGRAESCQGITAVFRNRFLGILNRVGLCEQ